MTSTHAGPAVIALAGRRIDAPGAEARFPAAAERAVASRLDRLLLDRQAAVFVSSAACGADIVGLEAAGAAGLRRRVILPFGRARFRETSVIDRPGNWGARYDDLLREIPEEDIIEMGLEGTDGAWAAASEAILDHASDIAAELGSTVLAVMVWNGTTRGAGDMTARFGESAERRGFAVVEVDTLADQSAP